MMTLDEITKKVLEQIDASGFKQSGAFNLRHNGIALCHGDSEHIKIKKKQDKPGIDIYIDGKTDGEEVHIPVVVDATGMTDVVYNDFYIEEGANVTIVAGCGIHNSGCNESRHDGIHTFHVEKNCNVRYVEKHYGEGEGTGTRVLNPVTEVYLGENSVFTLDTAQIKGVDSTVRENNVYLEANSKLYVIEKLMTHGNQEATSNMMVEMNGEGSSAQIVSRSVAKGSSRQIFHPRAVGKNLCHAHVQCDSIIMDHAEVSSIPEINAKHVDAAIIHEAAIGRINDEQLVKLRTLGMTEEEATKALKDKKLGIKVDSREDSEKYEEGTVSEQKTKAETKVKKHSTVHVVVSSALIGKEIIVPDVSGMSEDEAQKKLTDAGFKPISEFQYDDNVAEGNVISTTPAANSKAAKDTQIKMIVSKGAQKKTVPDVRGKSEADARSEIQAAGLTVGSTSTQHDDSVAKGNVISQSVTPGKKVSAGTAVNLVLSSGSDKVSIQNFAGKDEDMDNLKSVASKLLFIREGVNFACLMADNVKRTEAQALAAAIASGFLVPPAAVVIEAALLLCWAFAESVLDVRELFAGGKIPLVKTSADWQISLSNLSSLMEGLDSMRKNNEHGLSYEDYLQVLILPVSKEKKVMRAMDMIEDAIRKKGRANFYMDSCVVALEAFAEVKANRKKEFQVIRQYCYE